MKKLSDQITWFQNNALRLWREHWKWLLPAVVTLVVFIALIWIWGSKLKLHNQFDITLKIIGGFLAAGAISIAFRRTRSAEKGQYSDRFAQAVEQIANNQLAIRLGGLASIEALSKETEDEFIRVWTYLGEFLRYPPELAQWRNEQEKFGKRPDVAAVAAMLHDGRNKTHLRWIEGNQLPLRCANLQSADLFRAKLQDADLQDAKLQDANLRDAKLQDADLRNAKLQDADLRNAKLQDADLRDTKLQDAKLSRANLQDAKLSRANLQGASLRNANLQGARLRDANLQGARLRDTNLQGADLQGADLQGANLQGANLQDAVLRNISLRERDLLQLFSKDHEPLPLLQDALFSLDVLKKALHIKDLMPEKMSDVYYNASDGPLPDDWPDYKPRPITYEKWLRKKKNY